MKEGCGRCRVVDYEASSRVREARENWFAYGYLAGMVVLVAVLWVR